MVSPEPLIELLRAEIPDLVAVYHFGSTGPRGGGGTSESDIDLAVLASRPLGSERLIEVRALLCGASERAVDLVDLRAADLVITSQVLETGVIAYASDLTAVATFETTAMSRYCELNEERKGILEDIQRRGSIRAG
jgi:predicted nucleotidyltransferase